MRRSLIAFALFVLLSSVAAALDLAPVQRAERAAQDLEASLAQLQTEANWPEVTTEALTGLRTKAEALKTQADQRLAELATPMTDIGQQVAKLGAPVEGAPDPLAQERNRLAELQARHLNAKAKLDLLNVEADQFVARTASQLQERFIKDTFEPSRSILSPSLWIEGAAGFKLLGARTASLIDNWRSEVTRTSGAAVFYGFPVIALFALSLAIMMQRWLSAVAERRFALEDPTNLARFGRAVVRPLLWILALVAGSVVIMTLGRALGAFAGRGQSLFNLILPASIAAAAVVSFLRSILAPQQPAWRLVPVDDAAAREALKLCLIAVAVLLLREVLRGFGGLLFLPLGFTVMVGAASSIALVVVLARALHNADLASQAAGRGEPWSAFGWLRFARAPAMLVVIVSGAALILGYVSLADFLTSQFFQTLNLLAILHVLHRLADAFIGSQFVAGKATGRLARHMLSLGDRGLERLRIGLRTLADVTLILIGLPALLVQWAVTWIDLGNLFGSLGGSVQLGGLSLSIGALLIAVAMVVAGLFFANLFTRWLDRRVLAESRLDIGVKESIRKGAYYAAVVIALGFALVAAGLDFSNIAIIAGALGVGIGFGLQSIFNNFVSGLILLAERPVKVGDWVVVSGGEGLVKRINVRSTEIETFDSCTIIVPNSNLITEAVKNWTHNDMTGRFTVTITVEYGNNPQAICDLLEELARGHEKVLTSPAPGAVFSAFAQTGMTFDLRGFVANVFDAVFVSSDLRIKIDEALKARGVRMATPYPQPPLEPKP